MKWRIFFLLCGTIIVATFGVRIVFGTDSEKQRVSNSAVAYVGHTYPALDVRVQQVDYMFPHSTRYFVTFTSPTSPDTTFTVYVKRNGQVTHDDYDQVHLRETTYQRLNDGYASWTERVFRSDTFPYPITYGQGFIRREEDDSEVEGIAPSDLELDEAFDLIAYGTTYGHIHLDLSQPTSMKESLSDIARGTRRYFDDHQVPFHTLSLSVTDQDDIYFVPSLFYDELESPLLEDIIESRILTD
ncbi:hypothetical protein [Exiguobacterium aestuarii]|uniref:hypothetical protein n=1 Tax=Exiguobacterium aestuarii TaxID=273527 RepID=UPI001CD1E821|nr:hypothetical protein [Exiguobacterium aestuarii]MCA0980987.1 hypothetical protein [Exiguobacterium aestuarii]